MKSLKQTITEASGSEKQINIVYRLGVYEGLIAELIRSKKLSNQQIQMLKDSIKSSPIPDHLSTGPMYKALGL